MPDAGASVPEKSKAVVKASKATGEDGLANGKKRFEVKKVCTPAGLPAKR